MFERVKTKFYKPTIDLRKIWQIKVIYIIVLLTMFFSSYQLNAQELILSVDSYDNTNPIDRDEVYMIGTKVVITVNAIDNRDDLTGTVSISSTLSGYNSGTKNLDGKGNGLYQYVWDTSRLSPADDYSVTVILRDRTGKESINRTMKIELYSSNILLKSVSNRDLLDATDNDGIYRAGQRILVIAEYLTEAIPIGELVISSVITGYKTPTLAMLKGEGNTLEYVWDTTGLRESDDYVLTVTLKDTGGRQVSNTMVVKIDNTPPKISFVRSNDVSNVSDNDGIYHSGQNIAFVVQTENREKGLSALIQIKSDSVGYNLINQRMNDQGDGSYRYVWTTTGLNPAKDYKVTITLRDAAGLESVDTSLTIEIDNTPPQNGRIIINNGDDYTLSPSVMLSIYAEDAVKMYIFGDVVDDVNTFEWIPYTETLRVNLSGKDGTKKVSARFVDRAGNESPSVDDSIILDELPPVLRSVKSRDESDKTDADGIYHAGQSIQILVETDGSEPVELNGQVRIISSKVKYDSGSQKLKNIGRGLYSYIWNTNGLLESDDYNVQVNLRDQSNREISDKSLSIRIDNTPPSNGKIVINDGATETSSKSVNLLVSADGGPVELFLGGDIIDDTNTFEWIPYTERHTVNLKDPDGIKIVTVKFRDSAKNETGVATASINLDRKSPTATSIIIQNDDKYTSNRVVSLKLKADNAEQMFIDGDVVDSPNTFKFINYVETLSVELAPGDGEKRVGVIFRNRLGIQSNRIQDTIILDTTKPSILSVTSRDVNDPSDNDGIYRSGQSILIIIRTSDEYELSAKVRIRSSSLAYDSGEQNMEKSGNNEFRFVWNTTGLRNASDYIVFVQVVDGVGLKSEDSSYKIELDNISPLPGNIVINDGQEKTDSASVRIKISAEDVSLMFISGDIVRDNNTFRWIPYQTNLTVNLIDVDGQKNVKVKFKDAAGNESAESSASIILDRKSPYDLKLSIATTLDKAQSGVSDKYTSSREVFLGISAKNAIEMYISGDVDRTVNTYRWISYTSYPKVNLIGIDGEKIISVKFRNQNLIDSNPIEARITLDTTPPQVANLTSYVLGNFADNDNYYRSGQIVSIVAECQEANEFDAKIQISSVSTDYNTGLQTILNKTRITGNVWRLEYLWNTVDLREGTDYSVTISLTDAAGWKITSESMLITLDNTPPYNQKLTINQSAKRTRSRNITVELSAEDAVEMFISGDIREDEYTNKWTTLKSPLALTLISGDGFKKVMAKFRDKAGNETSLVEASIILGEAPPVVESVDSWDSSDTNDNDEIYHAGELVVLAIKAQSRDEAPLIETGLIATVSVVSDDKKYNLSPQRAREEKGGWYTYVWDTKNLAEGNYKINWNLSDGFGQEVSDNSMNILIDNTPPKEPKIIINNGIQSTRFRNVTLNLQAKDANFVFIDGNVIKEKNLTFEWIAFKPDNSGIYNISVSLTDGDGLKQVQAKFKDNADNITDVVYSKIELDTTPPKAISLIINDGAEYTSSPELSLSISASEADKIFIDGDLADSNIVRKWIPFQERISDLKLSDGDGVKIISIELEDAVGNRSQKLSNKIILDTRPPKINSVDSVNITDPNDDDEKYLQGTVVRIKVNTDQAGLSPNIRVTSQTSGYDSGIQAMSDVGNGDYIYLWDTKLLRTADDYKARIEIKDKAGNTSIDESLVMFIFDRPIETKISINEGAKTTKSNLVTVKLTADNASEMFISGDVLDDENTLEWVKFTDTKDIYLTTSDGVKRIKVEFRSSRLNIIGSAESSIILDQTPPIIANVKTEKKAYRSGDIVKITVEAEKKETGLTGTIQIRSFSTGYDSGPQKASEQVPGEYLYLWDTTGLKEGEDYLVEATLSDDVGWSTNVFRPNIILDNTPPNDGDFLINNGEKSSKIRSVRLSLTVPQDAMEMIVWGDVVRDTNTFRWIPVKTDLIINLTVLDGEKNIFVKFRDEVGNETQLTQKTIILNENPPIIKSITARDEADLLDNDGIYHAGQKIVISIFVDDRELTTGNIKDSDLEAWTRVYSDEAKYDSGSLMATRKDIETFEVIWDTSGIAEGSDYKIETLVQDSYGQKTINKDIKLTIDNTPPTVTRMILEDGKNVTNSYDVTLKIESKDAKEMYISGDVVESLVTFRWVPYVETRKISLTKDNGTKEIAVRLRDSAGNLSDQVTASIILDRTAPSSASIIINNEAKYTEVYKVNLKLSAKNAREMFISGDIVQNENTFKWIPYQEELEVRLSGSEGNKTILAKFRNGLGNESDEVKAQILLDFTPPKIAKIEAFDLNDESDNDFIFHSDQRIVLRATASFNETGLKASAEIRSLTSSQEYDSGVLSMDDVGNGVYRVVWNTSGLADGTYSYKVTFEDGANHIVSDTREIQINNQSPINLSVNVKSDNGFIYSRTANVELKADEDASEVYIYGDVIDDNKTFEWIKFSPDSATGIMNLSVNIRGSDGEKKIIVKFRNKARSESLPKEAKVFLELKRPELVDVCRITQNTTKPFKAYLTMKFDEPIKRIDSKNFFVVLKHKTDPGKFVELSGGSNRVDMFNDVVMVEISEEQFNEIKQWQPVTVITSYINVEISENCVFDNADKGNLSSEKKPSSAYIVIPEQSIQVKIEPDSFSPNNDEIRDKILISYYISRPSDISIRITNQYGEVIKEWNVENQAGGLIYPLEWNGKKDDGLPYPDGIYTLTIISSGVESGNFSYGVKKEFVIDNTAPQVLEVRPASGSDMPVVLKMSVKIVETPDPNKIESVYITLDDDMESRIPLVESKVKGEYTTPSTLRLTLEQGKHAVTIYAVDSAGNKTERTVDYMVKAEAKLSLSLINYPNPFRPGETTNIRYSLPEKANSGEIAIYDSGGDLVFYKKLSGLELEAGEHIISWNGRNLFDKILARGVYFCNFVVDTETGTNNKTHKIAIR